jgi:ketosteroid isomerase-like protein
MRAVTLSCSALLVVVASVSPGAQSGDARAAIEGVNRKFEDAAATTALYTADAVLLAPNAPQAKGQAALLEFWKAALAGVPGPIKLTTQELVAHGDAAHEIGAYQVSTADGKVAEKGKYVVIWKREGGQWKLHRDIWNSDAAAGGM